VTEYFILFMVTEYLMYNTHYTESVSLTIRLQK